MYVCLYSGTCSYVCMHVCVHACIYVCVGHRLFPRCGLAWLGAPRRKEPSAICANERVRACMHDVLYACMCVCVCADVGLGIAQGYLCIFACMNVSHAGRDGWMIGCNCMCMCSS